MLYWGLDYPPLTAYVSWSFGKIAQLVVPDLVELSNSRGHESPAGKSYMRATVVFCDLCVFIPACCYWFQLLLSKLNKVISNKKISSQYDALQLTVLLSPSIILIDHGHFQYNGVCLGFAILGAYCILIDRDLLGSIFYCMSLNFKQMSLYYAPVFFFSLLRKCYMKYSFFGWKSGFLHLMKIGFIVISSFILLWAPFCIYHHESETCISSLIHVLSRQFPFSRGIFEDKVSNLWYLSSIFLDFRLLYTAQELALYSLFFTILLLLPIIINLLRNDLTTKRMALALSNSALAFFLVSFQVN